eukprot:TRINITY_DN3580_c0_g1_i1.p1 TRINITY_DN3580_c0_g1~~TRINITY_DN3580_c0_g1_i1.p1  ORF type:complete len:355 (+),score=90.84 TRINITY_DN3580_c0_g1_i1:172-1236(+)
MVGGRRRTSRVSDSSHGSFVMLGGGRPRSGSKKHSLALAQQQQANRLDNALKFALVPGTVVTVLGRAHHLADMQLDSSVASRIINKTVVNILMSASRTQGKVDGVVGDSALLCWNVIQSCAMYQTQPVLFAAALDASASGVAIGIGSGQLLHGSVGNQKQRFHITVGLPAQLAEALAAEARRMDCTCLASWLGEPPKAMRESVRPVDTWARPRAGQQVAEICRIWQPELDKVYKAGTTWDTDDNAVEATDGESLCMLYDSALTQGSPEALRRLADVARGDRILEQVVKRLTQHQAEFPEGRSYRVVAPFCTVPLQAGASAGLSNAVEATMISVVSTPPDLLEASKKSEPAEAES